jgi:GntR family transcriptional regulator / MocR family aminotransferase
MGTDFLQLDRDSAPPGGLSDWLTGQLRTAIADGRLPAGSALPSSRILATELSVSRGVVTEAYRRLADEGQVAGRGRNGTRVVAAPAEPATVTSGWPAPARSLGTGTFEALRAAPCRIDLSPGVPDLAAFPRSAWLRAERTVLSGLAPGSFGYGDPRGAPAFRDAVANWLARNRGIRVSPDEVIITAGVAQALALLARSLRQAGFSEIAVEDPGSLGARQQLQSWGLATPPAGVDDDGMRVRDLRSSGARAVMMTPAHQFPMGVVLSGARRRDLRQWALDGGLVIEDDYDAEHRYDRPPVPALRAVLPDQVCYAGSVSKLLAPALRVGWLLVPPALFEAVVAAKRDTDLGNAVLPQLALAELMASGDLDRHHRLLRKRHMRRRDAMIEAVHEHLPQARVHGAAAGLHLTLTFGDLGSGPPDADVAAAALKGGVKTQPLSWHRQRPGQPGLVLGYAASTPAQIADGIAVIARVIRRTA